MDEAQIYAQLTPIFRDIFDDAPIDVTPTLSALDVEGWDSLAQIRLFLSVEKKFKIKFSQAEFGEFETVSDMVAVIKARA